MAKILKQILVLFAMLAIFAVAVQSAPPTESCGPNEEFVTCGSTCPLTCAKREPGMCTYACYRGCQCKNGFFKNDAGACVSGNQC